MAFLRGPVGLRLRGRNVVPVDPVEVEAAVGEVADRALRAGPGQVAQIDVADRQRLDILGRLGSDAVAREGEVARRQDAALRVLSACVTLQMAMVF